MNRFLWNLILREELSLCLISWAPCHERIWGCRVITPPFLTFSLHGSELAAPHPCCFTPRVRADETCWIGSSMVPRVHIWYQGVLLKSSSPFVILLTHTRGLKPLFMPLVILHHLLNVSVQLAKGDSNKKKFVIFFNIRQKLRQTDSSLWNIMLLDKRQDDG
jgi:hypothetical protein